MLRRIQKEKLPRLSDSFKLISSKKVTAGTINSRTIVTSSLCILILNILQIADILFIKSRGVDVEIYSDISIISRVVFFGASIFVWMFLSKIDIEHPENNVKHFMKLTAISIGILLFSSIVFYVAGDLILKTITGTSYDLDQIRFIGIASMSYRIIYVLNITSVLYMIVTRNKSLMKLPLWLMSTTLVVATLTGFSHLNTLMIAMIFNFVGISGLIYLAYLFRRSFSAIGIGRSNRI